ncbi:ribose ABC transporter permease [Rhodococcus sp. ACS1]|nr:ribose ABC transporter permease [Rhodococcus sp. ACS1]
MASTTAQAGKIGQSIQARTHQAGGGVDGSDHGRTARFSTGNFLAKFGLLGMLVIELVVFSLLAPDTFPTVSNFQNILSSQAIFMIVTLGLTVPVLAGEFDVSVANTLGFTTVLIGYLTVLKEWPFITALIVCILAGTIIGAINALLVVGLGINSFIATIGTGTVLTGLATLLSDSAVIPGLPEPLVTASTSQLLGLPLPVYYGLGLTVLLWLIYEHMPAGRRMLFVGAGREAGRLAGVRVQRLRAGAFIASGTIAGLAGLVLAGQLGASDPTIGSSYLLPAFAGVFLGATTIKPGRPNAWGTVIALYALIVGITGLQLLGAGSWVQDVFNGGALIVGVAVTRLATRSGRTTAGSDT